MKGLPVLLLHPKPSMRLRMALLGGHALALLALWLAALPWWLALLLSAALGVSGVRVWHHAAPVCGVQWGRDGLWQLELQPSLWVGARLHASASRSWPWWVYLDFRLEDGRRRGLVLPADSLTDDEFRRLRQRLKIDPGL